MNPSTPLIYLVFLLASLLMGTVHVAHAAAFVLDSNCPTFPYSAPPGNEYAIVHAINCANSNGPGTDDVIILAEGSYLFETINNTTQGANALPVIVDAAVAGTLTIVGQETYFRRADFTPWFRLFNVAPGGILTLRNFYLTDGQVSADALPAGGGGILNNGTVILDAMGVLGNFSSVSAYGAGIYNTAGATLIGTNVRISNNTFYRDDVNVESHGGAIANMAGATTTLTDCSLSGNSAKNGGSVYNEGVLTLIRCSLTNSGARGVGGTFHGGSLYNTGIATIVNSVLRNNNADDNGGGIYTTNLLTVINTTFYENSGDLGGGIYAAGVVDVFNATLSGNGGGGIYAAGRVTARNSIIANNAANDCVGGTITASNTLVEQAGCGVVNGVNGNLTGVDPNLGAYTGGYFPLSQNSVAVNRGYSGWLPRDTLDLDGDGDTTEPIPYDQRGEPRIKHDAVDLGAVESDYYMVSPPTPLAPVGMISETSPVFRWTPAGTDEAWFYLWIGAQNGQHILDQWYPAAGNCTESECAVSPGITLEGGDYTWWLQHWTPQAGYSAWSAPIYFSVDGVLANPVPLSPLGDILEASPVFTWQGIDGYAWYYVWIEGPSGRVLNQWYESVHQCAGDQCSLQLPQTLPGGTYRWWAQAWTPSNGYSGWSEEAVFRVMLPPVAPIQQTPNGFISEPQPIYFWSTVPAATWYYLWVSGPDGHVYDGWVNLNGCDTRCQAQPPAWLSPGTYRWWVQAWSPEGGYGAWSPAMEFRVGDAPTGDDLAATTSESPPIINRVRG